MAFQDVIESEEKPAILVINSQVIRGAVGGRASLFVFECLGYPVWFLPTVLLTWHPGHGASTRITASPTDFQNLVQNLMASGKLHEIGGILTGYLGDCSQANAIVQIIGAIKDVNPNAVYLCDPVIGDGNENGGGLYVPENVANSIRDLLVPIADVVTPNLFELAWLSGVEFNPEMDCNVSRETIEKDKVVVTSVPAGDEMSVANLLMEEEEAYIATHEFLRDIPHGTGDLLAALTLAGYLSGLSGKSLLERVTSSVCDVVNASAKWKSDELALSRVQNCIRMPTSKVNIQSVTKEICQSKFS